MIKNENTEKTGDNNLMERRMEELEKKGIISFSEWENISEHERKCELKIGKAKVNIILCKGATYFDFGGVIPFLLKEAKIETKSELFGLETSDNEELYFVFVNYKDEPIAYIPLEEMEVSE